MPIEEFAYWLGDGAQYPSKNLYGLVCCFKCYFEPYERFDVNPLSLNNAHFGELTTKPKQAEPITHDEEALLWLKEELGCQCARVL